MRQVFPATAVPRVRSQRAVANPVTHSAAAALLPSLSAASLIVMSEILMEQVPEIHVLPPTTQAAVRQLVKVCLPHCKLKHYLVYIGDELALNISGL